MPPYVVGASVGGGLGMLLVGYLLYRYYEDVENNKLREERKAEYYRQQAILAEQARAETAKHVEEKERKKAAKKAQKALRKHINIGKRGRSVSGGSRGAFAATHAADHSLSRAMSSHGSSSYYLSSLHSSEDNFDHYKVRWAKSPKEASRDRVYSDAYSIIDDLFNSSSGDDCGDSGSSYNSEHDSGGECGESASIDSSYEEGSRDCSDNNNEWNSSGSSADDSSVSASSDSTLSIRR